MHLKLGYRVYGLLDFMKCMGLAKSQKVFKCTSYWNRPDSITEIKFPVMYFLIPIIYIDFYIVVFLLKRNAVWRLGVMFCRWLKAISVE